jgi:lysophospholipase L1-like esterase
MKGTVKDQVVHAVTVGSSPLLRRLMAPSIAMRRSQMESLPTPTGRVLFLGDSITEQGNWEEWFPELATLNRGIGGDTVAGVRDRLDSAVKAPVAISLLVGTNDLTGLGLSRDVATLSREMGGLVHDLRRRAPDAHLIMNSVMPRRPYLAERVRVLNTEYAEIAHRVGATYLDLWPVLADDEGGLRSGLTRDFLHLNGPGYAAWVDALRPHLPTPA